MLVLYFRMQQEDITEKTNAKHRVFTLMINLVTIVEPKHRPHINIEHTKAKTLVSTCEAKPTTLKRPSPGEGLRIICFVPIIVEGCKHGKVDNS